jgi:hypothetical protein
LQVPQGKISRLERGDVEDVHVSTLLRLARALGATGNDLLRDLQDAHEDVKVSSTREHWNQKHLAKARGIPPLATTLQPWNQSFTI